MARKKINIFQLEGNFNNCASFTEEDVCTAIQHLQQPHGSTFSDIKRRLCSTSSPTPDELRSLKLATTRGIQSGRIEETENGHRFRLSTLNDLSNDDDNELDGSGRYHRNLCKKRKKYTCRKARKNMSYCSKYKVRCCKRRRKSCGAKPKKKPKKKSCKKKKKPKKKSCGKKKKKPKKKSCGKKKKPKKKPCGKKKKPKPKPCGKKKKPKPKPSDENCMCG
ncbi:hypothetical protein EGW08_010631 [Elysia chlorotica]|uniref:H15 domain-containing protein n=1 Tax=Elysia chlorotica TaxID=188477 RepID=A0A3S0ZSG0_ELYCH|nr:hypothetical protein EGW08_010631 [Elysia chlorotica]